MNEVHFMQLTTNDGRAFTETHPYLGGLIEIEPEVDSWMFGDRVVTVCRVNPIGALCPLGISASLSPATVKRRNAKRDREGGVHELSL